MKQFPADVKRYFSRLKKNNNRLWFEKHRSEYEEKLLAPAMEFISIVGSKIQKFAPNIIAEVKNGYVQRSFILIHYYQPHS